MMETRRDRPEGTEVDADLPRPSRGSRWRWATPRRAMVGGGLLALTLGLGGAAAGASTPSGSAPSSQGQPGKPPSGEAGPATFGRITALSRDTITVQTRGRTTESVTYTSATTFRTMAAASSSAALKLGDFIAVAGTKNADGRVSATSIMISSNSPGRMGRGAKPGGAAPNPGARSGQATGLPSGAA